MKQKKLMMLAGLATIMAMEASAQDAISASGGEATGSGGTVSYTVGQVAYTSNSSSDGNELQGVQQPYEIYVTGINENMPLSGNIDIYPNPTVENVTLSTNGSKGNALIYQLFDSHGRLISSAKINENETQIEMSSLPSATYFVKVSSENEYVKTFKIIKSK
jgi:opacity protein-like surface antigen